MKTMSSRRQSSERDMTVPRGRGVGRGSCRGRGMCGVTIAVQEDVSQYVSGGTES